MYASRPVLAAEIVQAMQATAAKARRTTESQLAEIQAKLAYAEAQLKETKYELTQTRFELAHTKSKLVDVKSQFRQTHRQLVDSRSKCAALTSLALLAERRRRCLHPYPPTHTHHGPSIRIYGCIW